MTDAIIVALITAAATIITQLIVSRRSSSELYSKLDKQSELSDQKIHGELDVIKEQVSTLKAEVQKHNQVIERTYDLERTTAVHEQELESTGREIKELKQKIHDIESRP